MSVNELSESDLAVQNKIVNLPLIVDIKSEINTLKQGQDGLEESLNNIDETMKQNIAIRRDADEHFSEELEKISNEIGSINTDLKETNEQVEEIFVRFREQDQRQIEQTNKIVSLSADIENLKDIVSEVKQDSKELLSKQSEFMEKMIRSVGDLKAEIKDDKTTDLIRQVQNIRDSAEKATDNKINQSNALTVAFYSVVGSGVVLIGATIILSYLGYGVGKF